MGGKAALRRTENGVHPAETVNRVAAAVRKALVAPRRGVVEVVAARALHEVAADGRHVPDLARGSAEDGLGQHRVTLAYQWMSGNRGISDASAEAKPTVVALRNLRERHSSHVDPPIQPR